MQVDNSTRLDVTPELAARLELDVLEFIAVFGAGWVPSAEVESPEPVVLSREGSGSGWYFSGEPVQLMLQLYPHGVFLARPEGFWDLERQRLHYRGRDQVFVDLRAIADRRRLRSLVDSLVRLRRSTFGYCRCCRRVVGPEMLRDAQTCHDCAERFGATALRAEQMTEPDQPDLPEQPSGKDLPWS